MSFGFVGVMVLEEEVSSHESPKTIPLDKNIVETLLEQMKNMLHEELDRRDKIKEGKRKESNDPIHVTDEEPRNDPTTSKKKLIDERAKEYYSSHGHSCQSSRRRSQRSREEPDRIENLGGYKIKIPPFHGKNDPDEYMD